MTRNTFGAVLASLLSTFALGACDGAGDSSGNAASAPSLCACAHLSAIDGEAVAVYLPRGCVVPVTPGGAPATVPWCSTPELPQPPHRP